MHEGCELGCKNGRRSAVVVSEHGEELLHCACGELGAPVPRELIRRDDNLDRLVFRQQRPQVAKVRLVDLGVEGDNVRAHRKRVSTWGERCRWAFGRCRWTSTVDHLHPPERGRGSTHGATATFAESCADLPRTPSMAMYSRHASRSSWILIASAGRLQPSV